MSLKAMFAQSTGSVRTRDDAVRGFICRVNYETCGLA